MRKLIRNFYFFLPVQLLLLHFRRYQMLLIFWLVLVLILTGNLAARFGASTLFLYPEYMDEISFLSMSMLGGAFCVFMMMWHITTFIIHSKRIPYMGAYRYAFLIYCLNNSIIPLLFLAFYSVVSIQHQWHEEQMKIIDIIALQSGFYVGFAGILLISFAYFFRVSRDFFKTTFQKLTNPVSKLRKIIKHDSLDKDNGTIVAHSYISSNFTIIAAEDYLNVEPEVIATVLKRHHRNVVFATIIAYLLLLVVGIYIDNPYLRLPAGAGFLLLFAIIMGLSGAFKYFLKSWETIGWITFVVILSVMVRFQMFDLRSIAYGLDYHKSLEQVYHYSTLRSLFTNVRYNSDKSMEEARLNRWKKHAVKDTTKPVLVVISVSGGGSRSAYWTFRVLQYADSLSGGKLFKNTVMITGASGGMIGATYWRNIHDAHQMGKLTNPYAPKYQQNIGKDLLNAIIFSFASIDLISPFNKITTAGYKYTKDRGYAFERELARITEGMLDHPISYYSSREDSGLIPQLIINGTIINDGRKLMICNQPIAYLTQPEYSMRLPSPPIDAVDYCAFFPEQNAKEILLTSALRMNATFPYVLPVVRLPSQPRMNIMDAGLRDNFGVQVASRYLHVLREWQNKNIGETILLEIRDTRENDVTGNTDQSSLVNMLADPLFVIQNKWEAFQSYGYNYIKDFAPAYVDNKLHVITLQYIPREFKKTAALNFHLTRQEKEDLYESINQSYNEAEIKRLVGLLNKQKP